MSNKQAAVIYLQVTRLANVTYNLFFTVYIYHSNYNFAFTIATVCKYHSNPKLAFIASSCNLMVICEYCPMSVAIL